MLYINTMIQNETTENKNSDNSIFSALKEPPQAKQYLKETPQAKQYLKETPQAKQYLKETPQAEQYLKEKSFLQQQQQQLKNPTKTISSSSSSSAPVTESSYKILTKPINVKDEIDKGLKQFQKPPALLGLPHKIVYDATKVKTNGHATTTSSSIKLSLKKDFQNKINQKVLSESINEKITVKVPMTKNDTKPLEQIVVTKDLLPLETKVEKTSIVRTKEKEIEDLKKKTTIIPQKTKIISDLIKKQPPALKNKNNILQDNKNVGSKITKQDITKPITKNQKSPPHHEFLKTPKKSTTLLSDQTPERDVIKEEKLTSHKKKKTLTIEEGNTYTIVARIEDKALVERKKQRRKLLNLFDAAQALSDELSKYHNRRPMSELYGINANNMW